MSEAQDPGGGTLESHPFGGGYGPSSGKDHFSPSSTSNGLTDLSGESHLTLLKSGSGLGSFSSFGDSDGLSRLSSDGYMEMRYIQLGDWDLAGYTAEGFTSRLIESRSLNDSPEGAIQTYRPWEKPDPSLASPMSSQPTTTSSPTGQFISSNGNGTPTTSNGKSPPTLTTLTNAFPTFSDAFEPNGQKLPSFQSQFNSFNEPSMHQHQPSHHGNGSGDLLHSPVPVTSSSPGLPSFHTLPANRGYIHPGHGPPTLVATTHAQPHFLDERHIQIFPGQIITATPVTSAQHHQGVVNGNGHFVTSNQLVMNGPPGSNAPQPHFITGNGTGTQQFLELVPVSPMQLHGHYAPSPHPHHPPQGAKLQPQTTDGTLPSLTLNDLHHTHHSSNLNLNNLNVPPPAVPTSKYLTNDGHLETLITVKLPPGGGIPFDPHGHHRLHHHHPNMGKMDQGSHPQNSPQIVTNSTGSSNGNVGLSHGGSPVAKKSQKRKRNSVETSLDSYHFNNNNSHDLNDPQVSSVSSTDSDFKRPPSMGLNGGMDHATLHNASLDPGGLEKPVKKKRKRCGECTGCQRKDNCGDCAPCRNEKSHQICKVRRCEKLTEKKVSYLARFLILESKI